MERKWLLPFIILTLISIGAIFAPVSTATEQSLAALNGADTAWMLVASALVLFMTPGLSFFSVGMVSFKNVVSTVLKIFIPLVVG